MEKDLIIEKTRQYIKNLLFGEGTGHDYYHIERVYKMAVSIANKEGANLFIVELASLLHDISDHKFNNGDSTVGGKLAREWLETLLVDQEVILHVIQIIETISYKAGVANDFQHTLEGKVVQDADRLDAIGAIGIARTFTYGGAKHREMYNPNIPPHVYKSYEDYMKTENHTINHFYEKLLLLKDRMNTETGKQIALYRHTFMENYLNQFLLEWESKDF